MAELTIPGDVAAIRADAERWRRFGEALEAAQRGVAALAPEWEGEAALAFAAYQERTAPGWLAAVDACHAAGRAVAAYADTLEWAQREAETAPEDDHERIRTQVATAGDDAVLAVRAADAQAPRTLAQPGASGSKWDDVVGDHPDPSTINAEGRRTHILWGDHRGGGHHHDSGVPGKTVFPEDWDDDKIMDTVDDVARNPDQAPQRQDNGNWIAEGTRDGVRVVVIVDDDGDVVTAYPEYGKGVCRNDEEGDPQPLSPEENGGRSSVDIDEELDDAQEADDHAEEAEHRADEHEEAAEEAAEAGDHEAASEHSAAAQSLRDEAETSRMAADQHRERADRAHDADRDASSFWNL
ncbi:EndoU domain-containing protein [Actinokineospora fastidiosa]|uniref:EndoU nuclease n=1 Tax=Actinokineospora fastidiosa TaxID=1816 RepID=A0A918G261_9PSEU|nr:EndoU domain-containing protein [Actinokineospora fastidiosa]GGS15042.1 hypothetical protein GCM10010171_03710 [Actinokineospora fastidiosa]